MALQTPTTRKGPSSRVLQRMSNMHEVDRGHDAIAVAASASLAAATPPRRQQHTMLNTSVTMLDDTAFRSPYIYTSAAAKKLDPSTTVVENEVSQNLFIDFWSTCEEKKTEEASLLDYVAEFEQLVGEHINTLQASCAGGFRDLENNRFKLFQLKDALVMERNSWRLIGKLYSSQLQSEDSLSAGDASPLVARSERLIAERLFRRDAELRKAQAVVDWVELNAMDELSEEFLQSNVLGSAFVGLENTLHALLSENTTLLSTTTRLVTELDPDARKRQKKPFHSLDEQEKERLIKFLFMYVRAGQLESAEDLCIRVGEPWRAATLTGWRLFHDPNFNRTESNVVVPVEGNPNRDVWKRSAWIMTEDESLPQRERAIYSALCGNAHQLVQSVCATWEDVLWALLKCMVDVAVEKEIRSVMASRLFSELPREFWDQVTDLEAVFKQLEKSDKPQVRKEMGSCVHRSIQKCLMLEDWKELQNCLGRWTKELSMEDPHVLRYLAHLVLVLRTLGIEDMHSAESNDAIEAYILYLVASNRLHLVAWYTAHLSQRERQIAVYSEFMESVEDAADRQQCLKLAEDNGLPLRETRITAVQNILWREVEADDQADEKKILAVQWLLLDPPELEVACKQTNALARMFVATKKVEMARKVLMNMAPYVSANADDHPYFVREYICLRAYVAAKDAFSDWFSHYHKAKPQQAAAASNAASFSSRVAHHEREKVHEREMERWRRALISQSSEVCDKLLAVLKFPGGWLVDSVSPEDATLDIGRERMSELDYLRKTCVPELVTLLHNVLHSTEQYRRALEVSALLAAEDSGLYRLFSKEDMRNILACFSDSAICLLESSPHSPFGF